MNCSMCSGSQSGQPQIYLGPKCQEWADNKQKEINDDQVFFFLGGGGSGNWKLNIPIKK